MSVDALMDSDQMSREMIERVGPRVALQPCDDPKYRELAQEFLDFAEECEEPITVIRLTSPDTVEVDYTHIGHLDSGAQLAMYNSILALHLAGEAEVPLEYFVDKVDWGSKTLDQTEKEQAVYATITALEALVPHATFFADITAGSLRLERDVVVIDSRFNSATDVDNKVVDLRLLPETTRIDEITTEQYPENIPDNIEVKVPEVQPNVVEVDEQFLIAEGLNRHNGNRQPKIYAEIDGIQLTLTQDEYAILKSAIQIGPDIMIRRSQVFNGPYWVPGERSTSAQSQAFAKAATRLCAKLPDSFRMLGPQSGRKYFLTKYPEIADDSSVQEITFDDGANQEVTPEPGFVNLDAERSERQPQEVAVDEQRVAVEGIRLQRKSKLEYKIEIEGATVNLSQDELAILLHSIEKAPGTRFKRADILSGKYWNSNGRTELAVKSAFATATSSLCDKLLGIFLQEGEKRGRNYFLSRVPEISHSNVTTEVQNARLELFMANFIKDFRDERPLGIDNFSFATLQKLIFGDFDRSLSLQPVELSLMLNLTEDIASRLLNYDLIAVDEAIIDRCYEMLGYVRKKRQAKELEDAIAENEHNPASNMHSASIPSGGMKDGEEDFEWYDYGNCVGVDPDLFFPERGASTREAKEVCRGCEVRLDCLEHALQNGEKFGIWGGLSERERRRIRRQRRIVAK